MSTVNVSSPVNTKASGPLSGVRILDLTSVVLGPMCTQILGDFGADIIKVESLDGDVMRGNGTSNGGSMSSIFLTLNRNKRSLAIDLKSEQGVDILRRLIPTVDVVVHNMRINAMERLGFGYEAVAKLNPNIVYCVATGCDQDGPERDKPAFDDTIQAACGLVALSSSNHSAPSYVPSLIADKTAGMALANAVLAALYEQAKSGAGQYVEVPMFETLVAYMLTEHLGGMAFEPPAGEAGYTRLLNGGRKPMPTSDGYIAILAYTVAHRRAFFEAVGRQDLAKKFGVKANGTIGMYDEIAKFTATRTTQECLALCHRLDIPVTPIYSISELPEHPQLKAVGLFELADHPTEGCVRYVRPTTKFDRTPASVRLHAPVLGQHSIEILKEAGYSQQQIDALHSQSVVI
jgi:crotonobetainyl-CoA:carnitine CoA-transferase CaiB-like acyl-CoA transferase